MLFHSTRGGDKDRTFEDILMQGLASDGGLFMPDTWPQVNLNLLRSKSSFIEVAKEIVPLFTSSSFDKEEVINILDNTWHDFSDDDIAPLKHLDDNKAVLELFHGPTAAFKDFGLQLAAAFFNEVLSKNNKTAIILGATSGDTGSAAIDACKNFKSIKTFILIPDGNMSEIQRRQMTTIDEDNVFTLRISGTFDDCQDIVKDAFKERSFLKDDQYLLAVNSINWVRIIGQICYYFYASLKFNNLNEDNNFSVPTGNFGNVFACYAAHKMGLPLNKIIVSVNENDILNRFFTSNDYSKQKVSETVSPSMDISVASNFERLIYDFYCDRDAKICNDFYANFPLDSINLPNNMWAKSTELFLSYAVNDLQTIKAIQEVYESHNYLIDPHTAVASVAVDNLSKQLKNSTLILSTAHPAKFPDSIAEAGIAIKEIPKRLSDVFEKKERTFDFSPDKTAIFNFIANNNF
jgi:threonine synthase|tara:strand:+ start:3308 stop:4696 length:1389 start_codon:yes stop_codon:yes gene_type:complete